MINFGTCNCGAAGQLFRTGKCAHCYIAELEADALRLADKTMAIGETKCTEQGHVWVGIGDEGKVVCEDCGTEKLALP
jgi:hypothetical protein